MTGIKRTLLLETVEDGVVTVESEPTDEDMLVLGWVRAGTHRCYKTENGARCIQSDGHDGVHMYRMLDVDPMKVEGLGRLPSERFAEWKVSLCDTVGGPALVSAERVLEIVGSLLDERLGRG